MILLRETGTSWPRYFYGFDEFEEKPLFSSSLTLAAKFYSVKEALSFARANGIEWVEPVRVRVRS